MDEEGVELWGVQCLSVVKLGVEVDVQSEVNTPTITCPHYMILQIDVIICFRPKV